MISLRCRDNIGNCLFEYCFARILAERFGYRLEAVPLGGFPGTRTPVAGEEVLGPVVVWDGQWPFEAYAGRPIAEAELLQSPGARLVLNGWFQRWEFFRDHAEISGGTGCGCPIRRRPGPRRNSPSACGLGRIICRRGRRHRRRRDRGWRRAFSRNRKSGGWCGRFRTRS